MNKPSISSLIIFLLPALLALTIMGFVNIYSTQLLIDDEHKNLLTIQQHTQELNETINFIQKIGKLHERLEKVINEAKQQTKDQGELYLIHANIIDELAELNTEFLTIEQKLIQAGMPQEDLNRWKAGFIRFKNFCAMATDIIVIDPTTAQNYVAAAQREFFDFSHYAYRVSEQLSVQVQNAVAASTHLLINSKIFIYIMFAIASLLSLLAAIIAARKLSEYHRVILSSMTLLTQHTKNIPELPSIEHLVDKTRGEIKNLGNAVLKFREVLLLNQAEQKQIFQLAFFDSLTQLPNRASLIQTLENQLPELNQQARQNVLIKINLNRFKLFNDGMGYAFGDELLQLVAQRLKNFHQSENQCFRTGGDEFALIIEHQTLSNEVLHEMNMLIEQLQHHLSKPFNIENHRVEITANLGLSTFPMTPNDTAIEILRHAMIALHKAKELGQQKSVIFDDALLKIASENFEIEKDLTLALQQNQLAFYLQSQVHPTTKTHHAEALIRWHHPQKGLISPAVFIAIAEKSDLIIQIDRWMLSQACNFIVQQTLLGHRVHISVNISGRHFTRQDFVDEIEQLLQRTKVDAHKLTLEITESILVEDLDAIVAKMTQLKKYGIQFSIDDFGTGYSSLGYLKRLPVNEIKIDKMFVNEIEHNEEDFKLVSAIFEVAKTFGLSVVVEGVETQNQLDILNSIGRAAIQGFIFAKPMPADDWIQQLG